MVQYCPSPPSIEVQVEALPKTVRVNPQNGVFVVAPPVFFCSSLGSLTAEVS